MCAECIQGMYREALADLAASRQREQRLAEALGPLITHYRRHTDHRCEIYTDAQAALAEYEAPAEQRAGGE